MATLNLAQKTNWSAIIPAWWDKKIGYEADREALSSNLAGGEDSDAPIIEKEDLTREAGDTIKFTVLQRLLGAGQTGNTTLQGNEEKMVTGTYQVVVDMTRHATAADKIARKEALIDFVVDAGKQIGGWLARKLDDDWLNQIINTDTIKTLYAGGKTSRGALGAGDLFLPNEMRRLHMAAQRRGVKPYKEVKGKGLPFPLYACAMSEVDYYAMVNDPDFRQDVRLAAIRDEDNPALNGQVDMYQGVMIYRWSSVNPGDGFTGSYLRPEAVLGAALTATATTINTGPASPVANVNYNKYFPTTGTLLIEAEQITIGTAPGNSSFLLTTRAAGGTAGVAHNTVGTLITLNNLGKVLLFGKHALMRAWATRPEKIRQQYDYEFELGIGIQYINGVKSVLNNSDGAVANAVVMETYSPNPNTI